MNPAISDVRALVFGGGGVRGIAYAGALRELAAAGLDFYSRGRALNMCVGSSIGALFAAMVAAGVMPDELETQARSQTLMHVVGVQVNQIMNAFSQWGLNSRAPLRTWIDRALLQTLGRPNVTFGEMYVRTGVHLVVVVTNLNKNIAEYWCHKTKPSMKVADAVLTSMSLPPIFGPTRHTAGEHETLYIDGGLRDNFPMRHPDLPLNPAHILGLKVAWKHSGNISSLDKYCSRIAYCTLSTADEALLNRLSPAVCRRICGCDVGDVSTIDFSMDAQATEELIDKGRQAVRRFLAASGAPTRDKSTQTTSRSAC